MQQGQHDRESVPPELDPALERFDDGPPRTMFRRFRPLIIVVALVTLAAFALLPSL